MAHRFNPAILREYDIRGTFGHTLHAADGYAVGRSFGTVVRRRGGSRVTVGRDGRLSSPALEAALLAGLCDSGIIAVAIGVGPTPMLNYAEGVLDVEGGIQVTGSHNPGDDNGFKLVLGNDCFFGAAITALATMAAAGDWESGTARIERVGIMDRYVARMMEGFDGAAWRIGWDAGNGAAGPVVEKLVKLIPGEHHLLFTDVDGHFPNHHPDPSIDANLADLRALVLSKKLDFGVAFDGDGDRIGVIDGKGRTIAGDQLIGLLAEPVLKARPGAPIVADVKASQALFDRIAELGGEPVMWKSGHSWIKSRMKQIGSPLGGEMSGHIVFADDYPGFDDGIYAAVRLIRAAASLRKSVTQMRDAMREMINTPELRIPVDADRKDVVIEEIRARLKAGGARIDETDGVRVTRENGWWLLRASNTQNVLTARAEATTQSALDALVEEIDSHLEASHVMLAQVSP